MSAVLEKNFQLPTVRCAVLALARPTFDMALAKENYEKTCAYLKKAVKRPSAHLDLVFYPTVVTSSDAWQPILTFLEQEACTQLLVLQLTFTDALLLSKLATALSARLPQAKNIEKKKKPLKNGYPIFIWSYREERTGGRLRLNSLCGANLATHALSKVSKTLVYPTQVGYGTATASKIFQQWQDFLNVERVILALQQTKIAVIGERPEGFFTCDYDNKFIEEKLAASVEKVSLNHFLHTVEHDTTLDIAVPKKNLEKTLAGIETLNEKSVTHTLKTYALLARMTAEKNFTGFAIKCWGEFFDKLDCAACGALALLNDKGIPASCEADVYGTFTTLIAQWLSATTPFLADWVDYDESSNTAVFWHCGMAPLGLASEKHPKKAVVHSNRNRPLLAEFPLKPGKIAIIRLSNGQNKTKFVLFHGEVLDHPRPYSGTAATVRLAQPVAEVFQHLTQLGVEHHYSLVYADITASLKQLGTRLNIPIVTL